MRTLVTGASGFIGQGLVAALAAQAGLRRGAIASIDLLLTDLAADAPGSGAAASLRRIAGDIADPPLLGQLFAEPLDAIFHLAGVVSGAAESDFALGKRVNLDATIALLERCRAQAERGGPVVRFVYASSIAVFGVPLPRRIDDATAPAPTLSYGAHKRACEVLIDDYARRGCIDGRALRLPGVVVRPALPNGALSGFNSDLIREPLAGRKYVCPVSRKATLWITSRRSAVANLLRLADADTATIGPIRALTAPALAVSVGAIVDAVARVDPRAAGLVHCEAQPGLEAQFGRWPVDCAFERSRALGLESDASLDALIRTHLENA
jgi:nucleoside-diphosphate-sugar epimerase